MTGPAPPPWILNPGAFMIKFYVSILYINNHEGPVPLELTTFAERIEHHVASLGGNPSYDAIHTAALVYALWEKENAQQGG